ncbi:hypothetical protein CQW23_07672 [Capsicum baccatum]|uniref:Uncharacterized protein n=1 Tax=Capsicum baccatum TaxID=33114 RepID=A0A2G2X6W5_CAPBA|nr:hypothetical protein CQW23_07672 [Capsicum baccatum]
MQKFTPAELAKAPRRLVRRTGQGAALPVAVTFRKMQQLEHEALNTEIGIDNSVVWLDHDHGGGSMWKIHHHLGVPKKGRTYGTGVLQSSSSPSLFSSSSSTLQTVEEMESMKKQILDLMQKCAANDAKFSKFEELVKNHMPQVFHDKEDNESDDN